jgi:LmbE family N-acetylglucosaminyl deacetylase
VSQPPREVVVLAPHLDDGPFSLGAWVARLSRTGTSVRIVTVLAGDPSREGPPSRWDRKSGFRSAGEAARLRREEDRRACALIGATPIWLPYADEGYGGGRIDQEIWTAVAGAIDGAQAVLAPGCPLRHGDHAWLTRLVLERGFNGARVGLYLEQPHAMWARVGRPMTPSIVREIVGRDLHWQRLPAERSDFSVKRRACRQYGSLFRAARPLLQWRLLVHEGVIGGEFLAWAS